MREKERIRRDRGEEEGIKGERERRREKEKEEK